MTDVKLARRSEADRLRYVLQKIVDFPFPYVGGNAAYQMQLMAGGALALAAAPADEDEAGDNLRLIDYIADKIELPETDELSQENFDAWMLRSATPTVGGEARKWIIDLIHNEYDPKPSDYRPGDNWNDGAEEIADQILERLRNAWFSAATPGCGDPNCKDPNCTYGK